MPFCQFWARMVFRETLKNNLSKNFMRNILIAPILACLAIAFINLVFGNWLGTGLWLCGAIILSVTLLPIVTNANDKEVPILQIFTMLFLIVLAFSIFAFFDFRKFGISSANALLYGLGIGLGVLALIMILKGKD